MAVRAEEGFGGEKGAHELECVLQLCCACLILFYVQVTAPLLHTCCM